MFHQKRDGIAAFLAAETVEYSTMGSYGEGRCVFLMERTQGLIVCTALSQEYKRFNDLLYPGSVEYLLYDCFWYHPLIVKIIKMP